uniref:Uncharacterized protein n=1 Tax=Strigamia maritima TaxID=126957 RepID=T1ITS5_STRMM
MLEVCKLKFPEHRLNIPKRPWVEKTDYRKCQNTCILELVQKAELCKLPFLGNEVGNLSLCESSAMAKKSLQTFFDILSNIAISCPCIRPCKETINVLRTYNQVVLVNQPFLIGFLMLSNIAEHIIEVEDYSLFALCADIVIIISLKNHFVSQTAHLSFI